MPKVPNRIKVNGRMYVKADEDTDPLYAETRQEFLEIVARLKMSAKALTLFLNELSAAAAYSGNDEFKNNTEGEMKHVDNQLGWIEGRVTQMKNYYKALVEYPSKGTMPHLLPPN